MREHGSRSGANENERLRRLIDETGKGVGILTQITQSVAQKSRSFNTSKDSRANHQKLLEDVDRGKKVVTKLKRRIKEIGTASQDGTLDRTQTSQFKKISVDFRTAYTQFERVCQHVAASERSSIDNIRRSSVAYKDDRNRRNKSNNIDYSKVTADQIYAQAHVTTYDEDELIQRENDVIHITHQVREVQAAYREINELITDQDELVVEITDNTQEAKENTSGALKHFQEADKRTKYCTCSKTKMYCIACGVVTLIIVGVVLAMQLNGD